MHIRTVTTPFVVTVSPDDSIDTAIALMEEHGIRHLPVMENDHVRGVVSDRDILLSVGWKLSGERRVATGWNKLVGPAQVGEIMHVPPVTIRPDATVEDAARRMLSARTGSCLVVRGSKLLGILTRPDVMSSILQLPAFPDRPLDRLSGLVEDVMQAAVHTLDPTASLPGAVRLMHEKDVHHIPITEGRRLVGVVSDRDLRRAIGAEMVDDARAEVSGRLRSWTTTVGQVMTRDVLSVPREETLLAATSMLAEHRIGSLPVTQKGDLVGIVTDTDVMRLIASYDD